MIIILVLSVCMLTLATGCIPQNNTQADEEYYADILFDATGVHMVDIIISDDDRDAQLGTLCLHIEMPPDPGGIGCMELSPGRRP